ncbi:hypothetical protein C8R43DRAFT_1138567 [Mycena crocata]|nr:hypothetical protein C8R43DRAFT_1138567 [Mycena crocata]
MPVKNVENGELDTSASSEKKGTVATAWTLPYRKRKELKGDGSPAVDLRQIVLNSLYVSSVSRSNVAALGTSLSTTSSAPPSALAPDDSPRTVPVWGIFLFVGAGILLALVFFFLVLRPCVRFWRERSRVLDIDAADAAPLYDTIHLDEIINIRALPPALSSSAPRTFTRLDHGSTPSGELSTLKARPYDTNTATGESTTRSRVAPTFSTSFPVVHSFSGLSESTDCDSTYCDSTDSQVPHSSLPRSPLPTDQEMPRVDTLEVELPIVGTYNPEDRSYKTKKEVIKGKGITNEMLKDLLKWFNKPPGSMRKADLQQWLEDFSAHPETWPGQLEPGARNLHRNPRVGTKSTSLKHSTRCRLELMNGTSDSGALLPSRAPTNRSRDERSAQELADLLPWAIRMSEQHPYVPKSQRTVQVGPPGNTGAKKQMPISLQEHFQKEALHRETTENMLTNILTQIAQPESISGQHRPSSRPTSTMPELSTDPFARAGSVGATSATGSSSSTSSGPSSIPSVTGRGASPTVSFSPCSVSVAPFFFDGLSYLLDLSLSNGVLGSVPSAAEASFFRSLDIFVASTVTTNGIVSASPKRLDISHSEIPDPPKLKFLGDGPAQLEQLTVLWSDAPGTEWYSHPSAQLWRQRLPHIQGFPIAMRHWHSLYTNIPKVPPQDKSKIWENSKDTWTNYKFIMAYREHTSDDAQFWARFPQQSSLFQVAHALCTFRIERDSEDEARAYAEYGPSDSPTFIKQFTRPRAKLPLQKREKVAERYRELVAQKAKAEYGADFVKVFVYEGRRGRTVMSDTLDIADKYRQMVELQVQLNL